MNVSHAAVRLTLFLLLLPLCTVSIKDPDFWWHLKTGQLVSASNSVPHVDTFSWSMAGSNWVSHEWLSELIMYGLYRGGGLPLLVVFFGAIAALAFVVATLRTDSEAIPTGLAALVGAVGTATVFGPRPQIFSMLLTSVFLYMLERDSKLWLLIPLTILWVNLHGAFAVGLGLVLIYSAGALFEGNRRKAGQLGLLFLACVAVVPINPHGMRLYTYPLETLTSPAMQRLLGDWAPPDFTRSASVGIILLLVTTFGLIAYAGKRVNPTRLAVLMIFTYAALRSGRHVPLLALAAVPLIAERLPPTKLSIRWWFPLTALLLGAPLIYHAATTPPKVVAEPLPSAAVDWLERSRPTGNLYNWYDWGGYLIWRGQRVWIDGRADLYGDRFVFADKDIGDAEGNWHTVFEERKVSTVMITPRLRLSRALAADPSWVKGYEDEMSVIYIRR
jgi:hypothetical protein